MGEHMDEIDAPFEAGDLPWLTAHRIANFEELEQHDGATVITAALIGSMDLGEILARGLVDMGPAFIRPGVEIRGTYGLAFTIETAGQIIDALTWSAERQGHGPALTASIDQARTARTAHHKATGKPGTYIDTSDAPGEPWGAWEAQWPG